MRKRRRRRSGGGGGEEVEEEEEKKKKKKTGEKRGSTSCLPVSRVRIPLTPGFFPRSSHTSDSKIDTPMATLPDAWHYRVSAGLVGLVSEYCDCVRLKIEFAVSISVW